MNAIRSPKWTIGLTVAFLIGFLGSTYARTAGAGGLVTNCSEFGSTSTPGVYVPGTLAAALVGGGTVTFACSGTIVIRPQFRTQADTTIDGTGQAITLSGGDTNSVFWVLEGKKLELNHITVTGSAVYAAIRNLGGTVTLTDCMVSGNTATVFAAGLSNENWLRSVAVMNLVRTTVQDNHADCRFYGAIWNSGEMSLTDSTVLENSCIGIKSGGGATVTLTNSAVLDNEGIGIQNSGGIVIATDTRISGNHPGYDQNGQLRICRGSGIENFSRGKVTLIRTTVSDNETKCAATSNPNWGAGISVSGGSTLALIDSVVSGNRTDNRGGGILSQESTVAISGSTISNNVAFREGSPADLGDGGGIAYSAGSMTITGTTVSGNMAGNRGGAISNFVGTGSAGLFITNSTLTNNSAGVEGGGISNFGPLILSNVTLSDNSAPQGANLFVVSNLAAVAQLRNTLIGGHVGGTSCTDTLQLITDAGYNLDDDGSCRFIAGTSLRNTDPLLGPLADNGGPTQTRALLAGSPARDRIPNGVSACGTQIATDQRGVARPQGSGCDIGAYEVAVVLDTLPPVVRDVLATPNPAARNVPIGFTAAVDDMGTGASNIASAEYSADGGASWVAMSASDGAFDSPIEPVAASLSFPQSGVFSVCVRGTDAAANRSAGVCTVVSVPAPIRGDFNNDGCVDRADYDILMTDIRNGEPNDPRGDLNGDGVVNRADARTLVELFNNPFGAPCQ